MTAFLAAKNLPLSLTDQLIPLCKSMFHDSKIVKNMSSEDKNNSSHAECVG